MKYILSCPRRQSRLPASFTVEAALLMTVILPVLLAILYYGFYLHDKGGLNGASQQVAAQADLNNWKSSANSKLSRMAQKLGRLTGASRNVSSSVSAGKSQITVSYRASLSLPGLLRPLFGKSRLDTGASAKRTLLYPADVIRKIRGLEYVSSLLNSHGKDT